MPSNPKIPKDMILEAALQLLIREGYAVLNIKNLAQELKCSTQPISWHFGNMDGLRKALTLYALAYANKKMEPSSEDAMEAFRQVGDAYISIAYNEPNLFRYLYLEGYSGQRANNVHALVHDEGNEVLIERISRDLNIPQSNTADFMQNTIIYTHGLASFIATNILRPSKEQTLEKINCAADMFLLQAGVERIKLPVFAIHKEESE